MIKKWQVNYFKSIKEDVPPLEFRDLTIFAGTNSSGKSTVIQSILFAAQALAQNSSLISLNGDLISLGTASDVWHRGDLSEVITIKGTLSEGEAGSPDLSFELGLYPEDNSLKATQLRIVNANYDYVDETSNKEINLSLMREDETGHYFLSDVSPDAEAEFRAAVQAQGWELESTLQGSRIRLEQLLPSFIYAQTVRIATNNEEKFFLDPRSVPLNPTGEASALTEPYISLVREAVQALKLPVPGSWQTGRIPFQKNNFQEKTLTLLQYHDWYLQLTGLQMEELKAYYQSEIEFGAVKTRTQRVRTASLRILEEEIPNLLKNRLRYLGANRIAPRALFDIGEIPAWSEVGIDGSNIAAALQSYAYRNIEFFHPRERKRVNGVLIEAVIIWLQYFGLLTDVRVEDYGKLGKFLSVSVPGLENKELDLTAIGFGTSQILPIVVQGLLTPIGGIFIVEQPEVHLHARLQSLLADFFFGLVQTGRQCIVETHSEHIVNFLRVLMLERSNQKRRQTVQIYFASRDPERGTAFEKIKMQNGEITNWPDGFMDEGSRLAEMILQKSFDFGAELEGER